METIKIAYENLSPRIVTDVFVGLGKGLKYVKCRALWDTGSSRTSISEGIVSDLELESSETSDIISLTGESRPFIYRVCIGFPDVQKCFIDVVVDGGCPTELLKGKIDEEDIFDVIIGMDIISQGDFRLKPEDGKHIFTFDLQ